MVSVTIDEYRGVLGVTLAYIGLHVAFQMLQSYSKWSLLLAQKKKMKDGEKPLSFKEAHYGESSRLQPIRLMAAAADGTLLATAGEFDCLVKASRLRTAGKL